VLPDVLGPQRTEGDSRSIPAAGKRGSRPFFKIALMTALGEQFSKLGTSSRSTARAKEGEVTVYVSPIQAILVRDHVIDPTKLLFRTRETALSEMHLEEEHGDRHRADHLPIPLGAPLRNEDFRDRPVQVH
jgi:hypothetical protein